VFACAVVPWHWIGDIIIIIKSSILLAACFKMLCTKSNLILWHLIMEKYEL